MELFLSDLHNPDKITAVLTKNNEFYAAYENQGFQETKGAWQLWEKMEDGRLLMLKRWYKKSIVVVYS